MAYKLTRPDDILPEAHRLYPKEFHTALEQLMRIEEFDEVMKEMRAKKNFKE
jgi:hypothetical protein